jgi:hypothetical protein
MFQINKDYMQTKITSIYQKLFEVIPQENKLSKELVILMNNYFNNICILENITPHNFDTIFSSMSDKFWKNLIKIIKSHTKTDNTVYAKWGYRLDEIILNETW